MNTRSITLTPDLDAFVQEQIESGPFKHEGEVLTAALDMMKAEADKRALMWQYRTRKHHRKPPFQMDRTAHMPSPNTWDKRGIKGGTSPLKMSRFFAH